MLYVMKEKIPLSLYIRKTIIIHSKLKCLKLSIEYSEPLNDFQGFISRPANH